jgi:hypothetical protein
MKPVARGYNYGGSLWDTLYINNTTIAGVILKHARIGWWLVRCQI